MKRDDLMNAIAELIQNASDKQLGILFAFLCGLLSN
jgi:hypothetical protein